MIKTIVKDVFFLGQKSTEATKEDLYLAKDLRDTLEFHKDACVGQEARIDGKRVTTYLAKEKNPTNLVLPTGKHGVVLTYSYTTVAKMAMSVSTISLLVFIGYLYRVKKDN